MEFFVARSKGLSFCKPNINATFLDRGFVKAIACVQKRHFGDVIEPLCEGSPDDFEVVLKRIGAGSNGNTRQVHELKTLRNLRPCIASDLSLHVDDRLENAELSTNTKHPIILPGRHALTRLIVLSEHSSAGHAGPLYTLMKTRQRFWIIHGVSSMKHFISECGKCALRKAKPTRQLMADLPACRLTLCNKPFKFCGVDYLGPYSFQQNRSVCKTWGILFTCSCTRCIHVEIVTSLNLNSFPLAFSRFTNLRGAVDTFFSDNGSTFCAASEKLPDLLSSTKFHNALRKSNINWVKIPPYSPSQGGSWESMVKLFKNALAKVLSNTRCLPSLIELQTFTSDAIRIVNDRPLTALSDVPNDISPFWVSSWHLISQWVLFTIKGISEKIFCLMLT